MGSVWLREITVHLRESARMPTDNEIAAAHAIAHLDQIGVTMSLTTVTSLRTSLAQRRVARTERQRLVRELASYKTPAERLELDLVLGRHSEQDTAEIEAILNQQAAAVLHHLRA
jgi:hypothetical protein